MVCKASISSPNSAARGQVKSRRQLFDPVIRHRESAMKRKISYIVIPALMMCMSCSHASPAGFWTRYCNNMIVFNTSDQGPWGGSRVIHWSSPKMAAFYEQAVRAYAEENGWKYIDSVSVTSAELSTWVSQKDKKPYFVLFGRDNEYLCLKFPRHIMTDSVILKFESGWTREHPGSGEMTPAYGYIQINKEGTSMAVYHLWGNG
jgi:hypothetical protein